MNERDDALTSAQRAALADWAETSVPDGFAERVMDAWDNGVDPGDVVAMPARRRFRLRHGVMAVAAVAAAIAVAWVSAPRTETSMLPDAAAAARPVLLAHCSPCHDASADGAEAAALDVFDLQRERWWSTLSDSQLQAMLTRSATPGISDDERDVVARFVAVHHRG